MCGDAAVCMCSGMKTKRGMWQYYAILSAVFAALTAVLAKAGVRGMDSDLATAIRTAVVLCITWGIVLVGGKAGAIGGIGRTNWLFLVLSGVATGLSWLFYFKALQLGEASKVAPVDKLSVVFTILLSWLVLREPVSWRVVLGGCLIAVGSIVILSGK